MGETGKRTNLQRDGGSDSDVKNQKRRSGSRETLADGELVVYRILCPDSVIGSVIGKSGKVINSIRQESRAKIKVVDPFPGANERVITIYCYVKEKKEKHIDDDDMEILCHAQDGVMRVHAAIVSALEAAGDSDKKQKVTAQLLVPTSQAANVIGKSGATIKKLRSKSGANIKITAKDVNDMTHSCAMSYDNFVQIAGDQEAVKKALYAVSAILYKFSPKEEISLDTTVPEITEITPIIIPSDVPIYTSGGFFPSADPLVHPPRSLAPALGSTPHLPELHGYVADAGSQWPLYSSSVPVVSGYGGAARSEELVVRVLCPSDKIGRVIGKGGSSIKSVRQATGARIDVDDLKGSSDECVITVNATESVDDVKSVAVEAVLLLQGKINDNSDDDSVMMRLLVPSKVIGCLIGKGGYIINEMRKKTKADIRISKGEKPKCAAADEELVEVSGEVGNVRDALTQIVLRLRDDVLKDKDGDHPASEPPLYPGSVPTLSTFPAVPSAAPLSYDTRMDTGNGLGMLSSSALHGYGSYQAADTGYGSLSSYTSKSYGGLSSSSEMVIPGSAIGKVMGKSGANIGNIRKISGAVIEIVESKTSRSDRIAQISGTPEQKRTAENLLQAFIMST
ncbi:KH domain-containing protein At4g18375 isoform X1 [Nymphaea colorata]|nr:KH domain-containing protein At4g18375 isoform X1 [Nymphaea colorata]